MLFTFKISLRRVRENIFIENMKRTVTWKLLHWKYEQDGSVSSLRNTCLPLHHRPGDPAVGGWVTLTDGVLWKFDELWCNSVRQICHKQIWLTFRNDLFELEGGSNGAHGPHVQRNTPAEGWSFCSFSKPLTKKKTLGPFVKILTDGKICWRFSEFCHTGVWRLGWDFVRHHRDWWVVPRVHYRCATYMYNHALRTLIYI